MFDSCNFFSDPSKVINCKLQVISYQQQVFEFYVLNSEDYFVSCKDNTSNDPFSRCKSDHEFRNRMIENHRDEDLCRRWDALADEDHTHHLTAQEYLYCKS